MDEPDENDAAARQCCDFICRYNGEPLLFRKDGDGEIRVLTGKSGNLFEDARAAAFGKVDIKGQI